MTRAEVKQRQVPKANMSTTNDTNRPRAKARTVTWKQISEWQFDNKYILSGYRPEKANYLEILTSLTFLHNETCNVYTHLIGALVLPLVAGTFLRYLAEPQFLNVSSMDYTMFGIYFWCAEICLVLSALYHLMQPHSHDVEQFWHGMDLLGIVIVTVGTFSSGIYYVFFCEASLQKLHWAIVSLPDKLSPLGSNPLTHNMLTWIPDLNHGHNHRYANFKPITQDTALSECEGRRLRCFWRFIIHTPTAWSSAIWA